MADQRDDQPNRRNEATWLKSPQRPEQNRQQRAQNSSDTYRDNDYDGGWNSQVGMDNFRERSGGDAYERMASGRYDQSYGRGPVEGSVPFDRGDMAGYGPEEGHRYGHPAGRDKMSEPVGAHDQRAYGQSRAPRQSDGDRGLMDRAGDEIMSWFGDEDAQRRREQDHRGKGPKDYKRSDQRVLEDVSDRLSDDPTVDATELSVAVSEGEVTLTGTVQSKYAKRRAEDCADQVSGVTHVQNNLRVSPSTIASESR